ncbi:Peroxisomal targeting signal 2 receptor [Porphyridium purpureum]|uniref:Peroxisomal targeting signal 2 receptor n=1 Tax=Porphyridium purpureum TaxID=35688 RepID=A0A5J4Z1R0_PORPP|nr:Peroxisomal targeting signal 2 receptor [Porphyridium purpureum]|eukprot:POR8570..scf208_2
MQAVKEWRLSMAVDAVAAAGDGKNIVVATSNLTGSVWEGKVYGIGLGASQPLAEIPIECSLADLCPIREGQFLAGCDDGYVRIVHEGAPIPLLGAHNGPVTAVATSGDTAASAGTDRMVLLHDLVRLMELNGIEATRLTAHTSAVNSVDWSGPMLLTASGDGTVRVWDTRNLANAKPTYSAAVGSMAYCAVFCRNGERIVAGTEAHELVAFDLRAGATTALWTEDGFRGPVRKIKACPHNPGLVAVATDTPSVATVLIDTGKVDKQIFNHRDFVRALAWDETTPGRLFSGSWDRTVCEIKVKT